MNKYHSHALMQVKCHDFMYSTYIIENNNAMLEVNIDLVNK